MRDLLRMAAADPGRPTVLGAASTAAHAMPALGRITTGDFLGLLRPMEMRRGP